jgi:uncharacterized membrane protein
MKENRLGFILLITMMFGTMVFAGEQPIEALKVTFMDQVQSYIIPIILITVLIGGAITYMQTKDWKISLVVAGISGAVIGGAPDLVTLFQGFEITN